jgi:hypothetical protein
MANVTSFEGYYDQPMQMVVDGESISGCVRYKMDGNSYFVPSCEQDVIDACLKMYDAAQAGNKHLLSFLAHFVDDQVAITIHEETFE